MQFDIDHITSLFENATEGFVGTDSRGRIVVVNPSACRMFGYEPTELVGREIEILIPSQYRHSHIELRDGFYHEPRNRVMGHGRDLHGQKKDGKTFPVEVSLSTYLHHNQRYVIAFIIDITHRKAIEESVLEHQRRLEKVTEEMKLLNADLEVKVEERTAILKEALQRLEQSQAELHQALGQERQLNEIKSRFVSTASHEFRTPLSTVLSSASLLAKYTRTEDQDKRNKHIEKIKGSVKHLNDLLEDFLSLGKLDEDKVTTQQHNFNLNELVQDTIEELKGLSGKQHNIFCQHEGSEFIQSDKKLLKNILINLVSNAMKFTEEQKEISICTTVTDDQAEVLVKDEGIGIPEEDMAHLFSSFFRARNATNIQGTGLGLHIVKRYVALLHGELEIASTLGEGTTISFSIPIKQA